MVKDNKWNTCFYLQGMDLEIEDLEIEDLDLQGNQNIVATEL